MAEEVLSNVLEQGGEHREQGEGGVVDDLGGVMRLRARMGKLAQFEVLPGLLQVLRCAHEERPQRRLDRLQAGLHDSPVMVR